MIKTFSPTIRKFVPNATDGSRRYSFTWSTDGPDRDQDIIPASAWDLDNYRKHPVVLVAHDYSRLPIGRALDLRPAGDGRSIRATVELLPRGVSAAADEVAAILDQGFPLAISPGFKPKDAERNAGGGHTFTHVELIELSLVPVPANSGALRDYSPATKSIAARVADRVSQRLAAQFPEGLTVIDDAIVTRAETPAVSHATGRGDATRQPCDSAPTGLCPRRRGQPCPLAEGCYHGDPLFAGNARHAVEQRALGAAVRGQALNAARRQAEAAGWARVKTVLLQIPRDRPVLRPFIDIDRAIVERMPVDVQAVVFGHLDVDSDLNGA